MALCNVFNMLAEKVGEIDLKDEIFNIEVNSGILHEVVCMQRANRRQGTASTKTKGEVSGGGAKPWRQKGTGRARSGSRTSPVWRGGGIIFGPKPRDYSYTLPKKVKKLALKMALSARSQEGNLIIIDRIELEQIKTKKFLEIMSRLSLSSCLVITEDKEKENKLYLSARNAVGYKLLPVDGLNVYDILKYNKLMLIESTLDRIEKRVEL